MALMNECEICGAALDPGEKCDCGLEKYIPPIRCTQQPIVIENIDSVRQNLELLMADISTLPENDEALKYVKQIRANLAKDFERMEIQRKAAKKQVMEPYEAANEKYQQYVAGPYKEADERLKKWVDHYQGSLKQKCTDFLREYFDELCQAQGIDFLPFSICGIVVDMQMARQKEPRKAMDQIHDRVMGVRADLDAILKMENAEEIMVEYRKYPSLLAAITTVTNRRADKEKVRAVLDIQRQQAEEKNAVRAALAEAAPEIQPKEEERYTVAFTATGSLASLKAMKAYGISLGITFADIERNA